MSRTIRTTVLFIIYYLVISFIKMDSFWVVDIVNWKDADRAFFLLSCTFLVVFSEFFIFTFNQNKEKEKNKDERI